MQSILWPETDDSGDDDGSGDDEEGDGDFFAALVQAEAVAEDRAAAAQAVVAPGVGPGLPGRSPQRDVEFKGEARAAFVKMELRGDSSLPHAHVLARDPRAPSGGRKTCPLPLWSLIQAHGGCRGLRRTGPVRCFTGENRCTVQTLEGGYILPCGRAAGDSSDYGGGHAGRAGASGTQC